MVEVVGVTIVCLAFLTLSKERLNHVDVHSGLVT